METSKTNPGGGGKFNYEYVVGLFWSTNISSYCRKEFFTNKLMKLKKKLQLVECRYSPILYALKK